MLREHYPLYRAGQAVVPNQDLAVYNKFSGELVSRVPLAQPDDIAASIDAAVAAFPAMRGMAPDERKAILHHCVAQFQRRANELAAVLCVEAGKPIRDSRGEVTRLIETFEIAAEEAVRITGEALNLEISQRSRGYRGFTKRVPVGPVSCIAPFNFPLNLVAHKVAPAIAAGCPFILKPASLTPISALIIGEILAETALPAGAFSILPCTRAGAALFTTDERLKLLSFTGSHTVGWDLKAAAGKKKVVLELGGNAACVIDADAQLEEVIPRLVTGAFYQSGQSCISVQRIFVHEDIADQLTEGFVRAVQALPVGDPQQEDTVIGPMISEAEAERLHGWIHAAASAGADLLCGGDCTGAMLQPTVLRNVPSNMPLYAEEAFGPVAMIETFSDFSAALARVNASRFGIHAGIFTNSVDHAFQAWDELDVGGVLINEVPSWRVDNMPYGGVKDSGIGREGIRYAIDDMTEIRTLVFRGSTP